MRVSNRMMYSTATFNMMRSEEIIQRRMQEIYTGKRINIPSDDPFGTSRAMAYRTNLTEIAQYTENCNRASGWLDLTDNSLMSVVDYLERVRELVTAGANDSNTFESWDAMAKEIDQIRDGIVEIANTTIDDRYIFSGEKVQEKAYEYRNLVYGEKINLAVTPITITPGVNDQFDIILDGGAPVTITLPSVPPRTYDNSPGNTLNDLANDIQTQLNTVYSFAVPVHVKATPDNKLAFYAGTQPPDNIQHTLVMRQTGGNGGLAAIGFQDGASTREIIGSPLTFPVMVASKYPVANTTAPSAGAIINLATENGAAANYYDNWTIMVDNNGVVQTRTVTNYNNALNQVTVDAAWNPSLAGPDVKYYLSPPLTGLAAGGTANTITLTNGSTVDDFYVGMTITITDGTGKNQTRTIKDYDQATGVVTVENPPFSPMPDNTSRYAIDDDYYINANNKFKITIDGQLTQEISLDGADYSPAAFAQMVQTKIQERGGQYANIQVSITDDNQLRIIPQDPLSITLESGSTANGLWLLGIKNGAVSNEMLPNYEGNKGTMNYEINVGIKMSINTVGDTIFDSIFEHLNKISMDLRAGNITELSGSDLYNIKLDSQRVILKQSEIGAKANRIEKGIERLMVMDEYFNKFLGQTEDVDITKAITDLTMQKTTYQAALQVAAQTLTMTLLDFLS